MESCRSSTIRKLAHDVRRYEFALRSQCMSAPIQLNDEDVAYLLTLLRNATQPMTTQQLIDALRRQSGQAPA